MNKDFVLLLLLSAIFAVWGLDGIISRVTKVGGGRRGYGKPVVVYRGRAVGVLMVIEAVVVAVIYFVTTSVPPRLTYAKAMQYLYISLGVGLALGVVMCVLNTIIGPGMPADAQKFATAKLVSLRDAAKYLKMPDYEVLEMAQNGAIRARLVNGQYLFDKEILTSFRDSMAALKQ